MSRIFWMAIFLVTQSGPLWATQETDNRIRVLILGDSISMATTPFVKQQLADIAVVSRPTLEDGRDENCAGTTHGIQCLDRWLADAGPVDLIFFNFGLHDLKRISPGADASSSGPDDPRQAEPEIYRQQLTEIVRRLKQTGAKTVFVTTTPVPPGGVKPWRDVGDPLHYNAIARTIVDAQGIDVLDLYSPALENIDQWQRPVNVHFNERGSEELAKRISKFVRDLPGRETMTSESGRPWTAAAGRVEQMSREGDSNYRELGVPEYVLPDVLGPDAMNVTADNWPAQREKILELFSSQMYGRPPAELEQTTTRFEIEPAVVSAIDPRIKTRSVRAICTHQGQELIQFPFLIFQPADDGPHPAIVLIHNRERPDVNRAIGKPAGFLPVSMLVEHGFSVAVFHTSDVDPDRAEANGAGIRAACDRVFNDSRERPDHWGCLTAWAWAASRVADCLRSDESIRADQIAVIGHSRGGKTALWAAAQDPRFAVAISNESGCGGAALSRRKYGETVERIATVFPYWFAPRFAGYGNGEQELPFDQHQLIGLIAPRGVCIGSASDDLWADPRGEYLSLVHAAPVYALLGQTSMTTSEMPPPGEQTIVGPTSYHVRPDGHDLTEGDWMRYSIFLRQHFGAGQ